MGLVPSRESLYGSPEHALQPHTLPFISRAAEGYMYKTTRTERVCGTGVASSWTGVVQSPAALRSGVPTAEIAHKLVEVDPNAVFIDDPAEATAAVAACRGGRRSPLNKNDLECRIRGSVTGAIETAAAAALRQGKVPYVYYYEHRALPLTTEFFPSPDCVLFRQLWHARQQQNPRYHFQLAHTWSPGALTDPTVAYESFTELAKRNMLDIQAACLAAGQPIRSEDVARAQAQLQRAMHALNGGNDAAGPHVSTSSTSPCPDVPFATREGFYNLVIGTTHKSFIYNTHRELRDAILGASDTDGNARKRTASVVGDCTAAAENCHTGHNCHRLRPVPCAIVLVRRCMPAHEYRFTYFVSNNERHHKTGGGSAGGSSRRRGPTNLGGSTDAHQQQQQRVPYSTRVCTESVRSAVKESAAVERARRCKTGEEELTVPWMQVSCPQAPLGLCELRVVGMYGCWTVEEILGHTLFTERMYPSDTSDEVEPGAATRYSQHRETLIARVLRRATPYGVPSHTLLNTTFFEKQVGDKEQCHTYFALCRLFAHGMRQCILGDTSQLTSPSNTESYSASEYILSVNERVDGKPEVSEKATVERQRADPAWQAFMDLLSGGASATSLLADLANCFLIRFSNIPQLQLCRQIRRMLTELQSIYPDPPTLEGFQAAQRQRNMATMSKKTEFTQESGNGDVATVDRCTPAGPPPKHGDRDDGLAAPPSCRDADSPLTVGDTGLLTSSATEAPGHNTLKNVKRAGKAAGLPRSLDPEAISERSRPLCEKDRLEANGFCCYASHGLVVFRINRVAVAHALNQLSFSPLHDSVEALCVTLTAAAPPPLTYRGELRPPMGPRVETKTPGATVSELISAEELEDVEGPAPEKRNGEERNAVARAVTPSPEDLENMYNSAVRYSPSCAGGFSMVPLWPVKADCVSWAAHAVALENTPDELIGVLPRNSIEQRRGRLLPLRGLLIPVETRSPATGVRTRGTVYRRTHPDPLAPFPHPNTPPSQSHASTLFQVDVYTVSAELDGLPFRELVEMMMHHEQSQASADYGLLEDMPRFLIESVDAHGNAEPDSVLNWSPMAALGSLRWRRALAVAGCENGEARQHGDGAEGNLAATETTKTPSATATGSQGVVSIFVHEPERILRTGDRIRFSPHRDGLSNSEEQKPIKAAAGNGTPHSRSRRGSSAAAGDVRYGYWYIDDNLTTEDMILSWMRRVGGRARETRGTDTKWVRFPEPVLQVLLHFAHTCRHQPGGGWLATGQTLVPLHPADEELVEPDILQNFPDILRTRRFRQWRFSHDGYIYFHGVTVRIPGSAPPPQMQPSYAASTIASAYHATTHNHCEPFFPIMDQRIPCTCVSSNALLYVDPSQQQHRVAHPYGGGCYPSTTDLYNGSGGRVNAQQGVGAANGLPASCPIGAMPPINDGRNGGEYIAPNAYPSPSLVHRQIYPYSLKHTPQQQQQLSHRSPEMHSPHQTTQKCPYINVALHHHHHHHHPTQQQHTTMEYPQHHRHNPHQYSHADTYDSGAVPHPHHAPTGHSCTEGMNHANPITPHDCGDASSNVGARSSGTERIAPKEVSMRYLNEGNGAGGIKEQTGLPYRSYHSHHVDAVGLIEGVSISGEVLCDQTDGVSLQSSGGLPPATGHFYGESYPRLEQPLLHPSHQQLSPTGDCPQPIVAHPGVACEDGAPWVGDGTYVSCRSSPNISVSLPHGEEPPSSSMTTAGYAQSREGNMRSNSAYSRIRGASEHQQPPYHPQQPYPTFSAQSASASAPPPAPPQPTSSYPHGESDRVSYAQERRASQDYPPRCSPSTLLVTSPTTASPTNPISQKLSINTLRTARMTENHYALSSAPPPTDAADSSSRNPDSSCMRPAVRINDGPTEDVDVSTRGENLRGTSNDLTAAHRSPIHQPGASPTSPQMFQRTAQVYRQPPQQSQVHPPHTPPLTHSPGSFRDTVTAEVIEANSITVRVMQRKPSIARQSLHHMATGTVSVAGYRAGSGRVGHVSNVAAGDGDTPTACRPSRMNYGAMGVSPSGGLESVRDDMSLVQRRGSGGPAPYEARSTPEHQSHELPQVRPSSTRLRAPGVQGTATGFSSPHSQQPANTAGYSSSVQRPSQRVSHNPYTKVCAPSATPQPTAAVSSAYSQGGKVNSSGAHNFFSDALDNRYGGTNDFNASASAAPVGLANSSSCMTHDTFYSHGAGGPGGLRSTPMTSQRPSGYASQRAAGDASDFSCMDHLREGRHESCASFYDGAEDAHASNNYAHYYDNAVSDGTAQGYYYSMGDCEDRKSAGRGFYGGTSHYNDQVPQGYGMRQEVVEDSGDWRACSSHGSGPAPARSIEYEKYQWRNEVGGGVNDAFVYPSGTPMSLSPPSIPHPRQPYAYSQPHGTPQGYSNRQVR